MIDWQKSTLSEREAHAEFLLNFLDQKSDSSRLSVAHQLLYISQGTSRAYFTEIKNGSHGRQYVHHFDSFLD